MANIFTNLPRPAAANGSGAAVDTSGCGADKYIIVDGSWTLPDRPPTVTIEINNDSVPNGTWAPLCSFVGNGKKAIQCAARWMRATVSNYRGGTNPLINFGSTDDPATFVTPAVPAADGVGAATDITALPEIKTITIGDTFTGAVILEYSEDAGGVDWAELPAMWAPGTMTFPLIANWIRVRRQGIPAAATPGTPIVNLGGVAPSGGSGGATDGVNVEEDGVAVLTPALTINFTGTGVTATDGGSDTADVDIPGLGVEEDGVAVLDPTLAIDFVGTGVTATDGGGGTATVTIPGLVVEDEGVEVLDPALTLDFVGAGVTVTDGGGGTATITIPGGDALVVEHLEMAPGAGVIDPDDDVAFLGNTGGAETTAAYTLAAGTEDGHVIRLVVTTTAGTRGVTVTPSAFGAEGASTLISVSNGPAAATLVWNATEAAYYVIDLRNFALA